MPLYGSGYTVGGPVTGTPSTQTYPGSAVFGGRVPSIPTVTGPTLGSVYPNLSGTNAAASSALASELAGQLSPQTIASINDAAASYGVTSGMPGSGLATNLFPRDIGLATEQLQQQGLQGYSSLIPSVASTQTVTPGQAAPLNAEIQTMNATNAAAPDPAAAGSYAQQLFQQYLSSLSRPAGGTGGPGSAQGLPWWQQTTTPGGAPEWGPQITTTRTFPGGLQGFSTF